MSKNKMIFGALGAVLLMILIYGFSLLNSSSNKKKVSGPKEFNVWVVGDESAGFSDIKEGFKERFPAYANTDIKFTKFSSYEEYQENLLMVMDDDNSPDVFVVNNNGGDLLETKIQAIPNEVIDSLDFSKRFNKAFDELILKAKENPDDANSIIKTYIKGIPLGYETLGVFYNWKLVRNIPLTWSELDEEIKNSEQNENYLTIALGLGEKYIFKAPDIFSMFLLQNGINTYKELKSNNALLAMKAYKSYATDPNNDLTSFQDEMDSLGLTTVDMFVRGKIGMIIGYPSLIKEIELAIKRTSGTVNINKKFLRSSPLPQISSDKEKNDSVNLINYNYFALSRKTKNLAMGYDFMNYLSRQEAQEKYLKAFPAYLTAVRALEDQRKKENISKDYEYVTYESFMDPAVELKSFAKGLNLKFDNYFNNNFSSKKEDSTVLEKGIQYIDCNKNHLIDGSGFEQQCN
ncbi:extracellular solute-binding protein [Candidatus Gracilibacteria bacterium]|nr:extracellular solute-binding protein [Candidatus Gracilibacteria bacterium]